MWVANNHSLCYYSQKDGKKLVLIDGTKICNAHLELTSGHARHHSFEVKIEGDEGEGLKTFNFAAEGDEELAAWMECLKKAGKMELLVTMKLGKQMEEDLAAFRLTIKNRRLKIDDDAKQQFESVFKAKLYKLKAEGNKMNPEDWFQRDMWIARNGCLVYYSVKEERELVYYSAADFSRAQIKEIPNEESHYPWAFSVQLATNNEIEFQPGEFAAESEDLRKQWITGIDKLSQKMT